MIRRDYREEKSCGNFSQSDIMHVFSDEAETTVQQPETEADQTGSTDSSEEIPVEPENPAETPDVIETPEITETPETTEAPEATEAPDATTEDSTDPGDDFSAGDAQELHRQQIPQYRTK